MSSGDAVTGAENRCEPTTWMMSPPVMYFLDASTFAKNFSFVWFDSNSTAGISLVTATAVCSLGCSSRETMRSISLVAFS